MEYASAAQNFSLHVHTTSIKEITINMYSLTFNFICLIITIACDSITGGNKLACTHVGTNSISARGIHVKVVGFGSAFVGI